MSYRKFKPNDIILNTMKAHPTCEFLVFDGRIYYNNISIRSGSFGPQVPITGGFLSLYEYNVDRHEHRATDSEGNYKRVPPWDLSIDEEDAEGNQGTAPYDEGIIYPYITKDSARSSFKTAGKTSYNNEFQYGDVLRENYPMSASITREFMYYPAGFRKTGSNKGSLFLNDGETPFMESPIYPHYYALRNRLNFYGLRSVHYKVIGTASMGGAVDRWNKDGQQINLISIPSIFYGTKIKPGSISLKTYYTGTLAGELRDSKRNGELIQVANSSEHATSLDGKVAGVVLYDEGFILLTGSWDLSPTAIPITTGSGDADDQLKWIYFGAGAQDSVTQATAGTNYKNASFNLSFRGTTETQVMTMFAKAKRGEVNYSNNPTFMQYGQTLLHATSSKVYEENPNRIIKNITTSSYSDFSASFKRQVYISRVALYDESKNLIGIATLSNPVRKEEDQDLTFKIRLDI
tara:strand:+ start:380 stop:1765 length:1386 start_codon:yes stop_codon:yes gene_type:complete